MFVAPVIVAPGPKVFMAPADSWQAIDRHHQAIELVHTAVINLNMCMGNMAQHNEPEPDAVYDPDTTSEGWKCVTCTFLNKNGSSRDGSLEGCHTTGLELELFVCNKCRLPRYQRVGVTYEQAEMGQSMEPVRVCV